MVLGHQGLNSMSGPPSGIQPALQLAAVAAHLVPRSRLSWAPFLQFGVANPMLFGAPFLTRPHFNGTHSSQIISGNNNNSQSSGLSSNRSVQSQQSEDSNDERGELQFYFQKCNFYFPTEFLFALKLQMLINSFICHKLCKSFV